MRSSNRNETYTITEYGSFVSGESRGGYKGLPHKTFEALENFILTNVSGSETETIELLSLSARRGIGKIITARNYVGLISMTDGTVIEILPKIAGNDISQERAKLIFLEMLKTLKDISFKDLRVSNLHSDQLNLLEIFIRMFLNEVSVLTKQGLKAAYQPIEGNERFFKGKLLASQNIKYNLINQERFFVRYDEFSLNRPENRLIKSTLRFLLKQTADSRNRHDAARLLTFFERVDFSERYESDFARCISDRSMNHYERALSWCRIFLRGNSFTPYSGSEVALALLFPMEKVFESFIAEKIRIHLRCNSRLGTQDTRYSLFDHPAKFNLRPDLVLETEGRIIVMDTKWKLLSDSAGNKGISQADMYQMYAYSKKYKADGIVVIYPQSDGISSDGMRFTSEDDVQVVISFIDLKDADTSIMKLVSVIDPMGSNQ